MTKKKNYCKTPLLNKYCERVPAYRYPDLPVCHNDSEDITITLVNKKDGLKREGSEGKDNKLGWEVKS